MKKVRTEVEISRRRLSYLKDVKRLVVKIGSRVISDEMGLNISHMEALISDMVDLHRKNKEIIIVSSGAIVAGMREMGLSVQPKDLSIKQAAAAIGQGKLMEVYRKLFETYGIRVAQILLTREDMIERKRFLNSRNTILKLLEWGIIPVVNENDTVSVEEIRFGDNDLLSALVASLIDAELLLILSDIDGLFTEDPSINPEARLIPWVDKIDEHIESIAGDSISIEGTGGMRSKIEGARKAVESGIPTIIINGKIPGLISKVLEGYKAGTFFSPCRLPISRRKHWILHTLPVRGRLIIDDGATEAILEKGKSLLPAGIIHVSGNFDAGDAVICMDKNGREIAKGLVNYTSREIDRIKGRKTGEIISILGFKDYDEVIHRDNMVILR